MRSIILVTYEATSQEKAVLGRKREETLMNSWKEFNAIAIPLLIECVNDEIVDKTGHAIVTFERVRFKQNIPFYRFIVLACSQKKVKIIVCPALLINYGMTKRYTKKHLRTRTII